MAKKAQSFKVDTAKKIITIYNGVEQTDGEKSLMEFYLNQGYAPMFDTKKKGKSVSEMREEMKNTEALKEFNAAYSCKDKAALAELNKKYNTTNKSGFHIACKIYAEWKKANK